MGRPLLSRLSLQPRAFARRALRQHAAFSSSTKSDYVVVGAGSAGCVVASRLAEGGASVTLLEAGDASTLRGPLSILTRMPTALSMPMHWGRWNWAYETAPSPALDGKRVSCPRGRGLGGSSSINGMVYVRGHALDYEAWADAGCRGWRWVDVAPYFKKMEHWAGDDADGLRGRGGPLHVTDGANALGTPLYEAFQAAGDAAGYGRVADYNGRRQEGLAPMPMTVFHEGPRRGERCSTFAAYLEPAMDAHDALGVVTGARAARVEFDGTRAVAVATADGRRFEAEQEVILCAGAIATPQLLQISGVGPADLLESLGVDVVVAADGVGSNLQDHLEFYFQFAVASGSLAPYLAPWRKLLIGLRWLLRRDGLGATNHFEAGGFVRSAAGKEYPDVQFHFLPVAVSYDGVTVPHTASGHSFQLHVGCNRSQARGAVAAAAPDVETAPAVDFAYMSHDDDWTDYRAALRLARELVGHMDLEGVEEVTPGASCATDEQIDAYLREHLESAYHPCGTCRMGDDAGAVCDAEGRVFGAEGLRVVDASLFPSITNGNLNAPTIMVAEKLSDAILGNAPPPPVAHAMDHPRGHVDPKWATRQREKPFYTDANPP